MKTYLVALCFLLINPSGFAQEIIWGEVNNGLQLGVEEEDGILEIQLKNVSNQPLKVCRHLNGQELEFYRIEFWEADKMVHELFAGLELQKGTQQYVEIIMPKELIVQKFALKDWETKNGNKKIPSGNYRLVIYYEVSHCYALSPDHWNGTVRTGSIPYQIR
jgi:hypothetical protein